MDLRALKQELADAKYAVLDDDKAAKLLNQTEAIIDRESITGGELAASVVRSELSLMDADEQTYVLALFGAGAMPLTPNLKSELGELFPQQSQSRKNVVTILKRTGNRSEELGLGRVTPSDVAKARKLP